jgi:hypothetical protein
VFWIKRGYDSKKAEKRFLKVIRPSVRPPSIRPSVSAFYPNPSAFTFWMKRGYDLKRAEKRFMDHIRVLSFWIKRGYD